MKPIFIVLLAIGLFGCDAARQGGQFASNQSHWNGNAWPQGAALIHSGVPLGMDGQHAGLQQGLLYVLLVYPEKAGGYFGFEDKWGSRVSTFKCSNDRVKFSIPWDRRDDTVSIGGQKFHRSDGNVFVVRTQRDGKMSAQQLSNYPTNVYSEDFDELFRHIRKQLPADKMIESLPQR